MWDSLKNMALVIGLITAIGSFAGWVVKPHAAEFVIETVQSKVDQLETELSRMRRSSTDTKLKLDDLQVEQQIIGRQQTMIIQLLQGLQRSPASRQPVQPLAPTNE